MVHRLLIQLAIFLTLVLLTGAAPRFPAYAATYGSDNYGSGPFNTGVDPAPEPAPSGGGVVIGGPLGIGYVATNSTTTVTVSTPTLSTSTPISTSTSAGNGAVRVPSEGPATFPKPLQYRDRDRDVRALQEFLNTHGFPLAQEGDGAAGHETDFFGRLTFAALVAYQNAHAAEILAPLGLTAGTGYFGPATMSYANSHP
jgi:hypothetical protein